MWLALNALTALRIFSRWEKAFVFVVVVVGNLTTQAVDNIQIIVSVLFGKFFARTS